MKLKDYVIPQYGLDDGAGQEELGQYSLKSFDLKTFQVTGKQPDPVVLDPGEVRFGPHFTLQQPLYIPPSASQSWKMPRWVLTMVGLFFGSAALLTVAVCVVLLRDAKAPATEPSPVPAAPATASATASAMHAAAPPVRRIVVSRHPSVVRRQLRGARRVASKSASSSPAPQELETASSRPPKDALDQLLSESSL